MQDWRALAKFEYGKEALVVLGVSQFQINETYKEAFLDIIHPDIQSECTSIVIQKWSGRPKRGRWIDVGTLHVPK